MVARFCQLATSLLRPTDLFGRIGGEEFASLLPDTTRQDALLLAERLRAAFEATTHTLADGPLSATASVGVAISDDASSDLLPSWMWQIRPADLVFDGPWRREAAGSSVGITWLNLDRHCFRMIAAGENASPFAQYHQLVWTVHNRVPVKRARRVEAIVAVEDGLNPPPSPP